MSVEKKVSKRSLGVDSDSVAEATPEKIRKHDDEDDKPKEDEDDETEPSDGIPAEFRFPDLTKYTHPDEREEKSDRVLLMIEAETFDDSYCIVIDEQQAKEWSLDKVADCVKDGSFDEVQYHISDISDEVFKAPHFMFDEIHKHIINVKRVIVLHIV